MRAGPLLFAAGLVLAVASNSSAAVPDWIPELKSEAMSNGKTAESLVRECVVQIGPDGHETERHREVILIPGRAEKSAASLGISYVAGYSRVRDLHVWRVTPDGRQDELPANLAVDIATDPAALYSESRMIGYDAASAMAAGGLFAYEYTIESPAPFAMHLELLQSRLRCHDSRVVLRVPRGWVAEGLGSGAPAVTATLAGDSLIWRYADLPAIPDEPLGLSPLEQIPKLALRWRPESKLAGVTSFGTWSDVAEWFAELSAGSLAAGPELAARASGLTAAMGDDLARARAICESVQRIRYVSVQIGEGRYRPHDANDVAAKGYGDCKDKAALASAMLSSVGIKSWLVLANAGPHLGMDSTWASPMQFDHCILAVSLPDAERFHGGVRHPGLGPLLLFDPTDPYTPFGELPQQEQGGLGVVAAASLGGAVRFPTTTLEQNAREHEISVVLQSSGRATAHFRIVARGAEAARERAFKGLTTAGRYDEALKRWCRSALPGCEITRFEAHDEPDSGRYRLELDSELPAFAQKLPDGSLVVAPIAIGVAPGSIELKDQRVTPLRVPGGLLRERLTISLPPGSRVEELPAPSRISNEAGAFALDCKVDPKQVVCASEFQLQPGVFPKSHAAQLRDVVDRATAAARSRFLIMGPAAGGVAN